MPVVGGFVVGLWWVCGGLGSFIMFVVVFGGIRIVLGWSYSSFMVVSDGFEWSYGSFGWLVDVSQLFDVLFHPFQTLFQTGEKVKLASNSRTQLLVRELAHSTATSPTTQRMVADKVPHIGSHDD